jgi:tRNA (guanine26-N2/guanine27-N2)-dimethyltransferase
LKLVRLKEGRTVLLVPAESLALSPPPTSPVFFNPAASVSRDVSVALSAAGKGETFLDAMAGVGARGVRVAKESGTVSSVTLVDFNLESLKVARKAAALNGVKRKCEFANSETTSYLFSRFGRDQRYDYVDVDPFGTPARQVQGGLSATAEGGVLSLTATDTAVLCGVHKETCVRRYGAVPLNNHFAHESGLRILAGYVAKQGASLDIGVEPIAAHSTRHYLRVYVRVMPGASKADAALRSMGFVKWCPACGEVTAEGGEVRCGVCGKKAKVAGPLWAGKMTDDDAVAKGSKRAEEFGLGAAKEILASLGGVDSFPPWSFSTEEICSSLRIPSVPEDRVYLRLTRSGRRVMRTPFEKTGIKTDARYSEVVEAVRGASSEGGA